MAERLEEAGREEDGHLIVAELSPKEWLIVVGSEFSFAEHTFFSPSFFDK